MMRSCLKTARAFRLLAVPLLLATVSAGLASAKESGEGPDGDPSKKERFVWTETRDVFEFAGVEELAAIRTQGTKTQGTKTQGTKTQGTKTPGGTPRYPNETPAQRILRVRTEAEACASAAEGLLASRDYSTVVDDTAMALGEIKRVQLAAPVLSEKLKRFHETARRMNERAEIEREFTELQINIGGIAWSLTSPVALINGKVVGPGESVAGARVEKIQRDAVVFSLKGIQVRRRSGMVPSE